MLEVRAESDGFEGMFQKALFNRSANFLTVRQKKLSHGMCCFGENVRCAFHLNQTTKPQVKSRSGFPTVLYLRLIGYILTNALQEIPLNEITC